MSFINYRVTTVGFIVLLLCTSTLLGGELSKVEQHYKLLSSYKLKDFHFAKPVVYMDIARFNTKPFSDGKKFELPKGYTFHTILKVGKLSMSKKIKNTHLIF